MDFEVTKKGLISLGVLGVVVGSGYLYLHWRSTLPEDLDRSIDEAVEGFESQRWERPPLETQKGEVASTNAFDSLRPALKEVQRDDLPPFRADGSGTRKLRERKLSKEARTYLQKDRVRKHVGAVRRAMRTSWSWAGTDLGAYVDEAGSSGRDGLKNATKVIFRTARMLAADALRLGGERCLRRSAEMARLAQDVSAGAPLVRSATRTAVFGMLQYVVPPCAAEASPEALARARRWFRTLLAHPVPMGRSLEAEVLTMAIRMRASLRKAGAIPTNWQELRRTIEAPTLVEWTREMLEHRAILRRVQPREYPGAERHLKSYREAFDVSTRQLGAMLLRGSIARDQQAQNSLRLALVTLAHYERLSEGGASGEASRRVGESAVEASRRAAKETGSAESEAEKNAKDESSSASVSGPPDVVDASLVRDAVTGEPLIWKTFDASQDGAFDVCYLRPKRLRRGADSKHYCWVLPPASR